MSLKSEEILAESVTQVRTSGEGEGDHHLPDPRQGPKRGFFK